MRSDAQANWDRVLAAAEEVFGESGQAGSTEEVARRAGVGIGTVFRHFPTKRQLIEATIVRHLTLLAATARARGRDGEAGAAFRLTLREMVSGAPAKLALLELLEEPAGNNEGVGAAASALRDAVEVLLSRGQKAGEVRADATVDEVYVLIRALAGARGERAVVDRAVDIVLDGLGTRSFPRKAKLGTWRSVQNESACRLYRWRRASQDRCMREEVLTDQLWARLEPLLPVRPRRFRYPGRKRADDRAALEGILYVIRTGIGWNRLPTALFGASGATCWRRLTEWHEAGVWQQLHERLLAELRAAGLLDLSAALVDSTHLRALKKGATPDPARATAAGSGPSTT